MPALPSFRNYKPNWKAKTAIKTPFSLRRGENPASTSPPKASNPSNTEVIDIKDDRSSLDFDGGKPNDFESNIVDSDDLPTSRPSDVSVSPPTRLEVDLAPEALTDWFAANFPGGESHATSNGGGDVTSTRNLSANAVGLDHVVLEGIIEEDFEKCSEDVIADLEALDASHFATLPSPEHTRSESSKKPSPTPLTIPEDSPRLENGLRKQPRDSITMLTSRLSLTDTPASSALSGTTLARALFSNTFTTFNDSRWSGYRSGAGLTRSDSAVLPLNQLYRDRDQFSIGPDAPPMPAGAETLYEAPKRPRSERRKQLKRRSSTGSLQTKFLPDVPTTRPNSLLLSPTSEFDILKSPDPWLSAPMSQSSFAIHKTPNEVRTPVSSSSERGKVLPETDTTYTLPPLPEGVRRLPDPLSPPPTAPSSTNSTTGLTDSRAVDDVLGYYTHPDPSTPLIAGATFRPAVSPIREETSSQLSPSTPLRNERRDSRRLLPLGARSQTTGSLRIRSDSVTHPRRASDAQPPLMQILPPAVDSVLRTQTEQFDQHASLPDNSASPQYGDHAVESFPRSITRAGMEDTPGQDAQDAQDVFSSNLGNNNIENLNGEVREQNSAAQLLQCTTPAFQHSRQPSPSKDKTTTTMPPVAIRIQNVTETTEPVESPVEPADNLRQNHVDDQAAIANDISRPPSLGAQSDGSSMYTDSSRTRIKILPPIPIVTPTFGQSSDSSLAATNTSGRLASAPSNTSLSPVRSNSTSNVERGKLPPTLTITSSTNVSTIAVNGNHNNEGESTGEEPEFGGPALSTSQHRPTGPFYKDDYMRRDSALPMGSPPPYYEAINQSPMPHHHNPNVARVEPHPVTGPSRSSGHWNPSDARREGGRARPRPPLPAGPRRPSHGGLTPAINPASSVNRSASVGSTSRSVAPGLSIQRSTMATMSSPNFQTPPPKWRGYTMEAAKWTFTSPQLQTMVTRAIRQSAEASSIRLLPLEILDNEIPEEIRRLEAQRTDVKTRYKVLSRRRAVLFEAFSAYIVGNSEEDAGYAHHLLEDLSEMAITLDRLAEELHRLDFQLAYLDSQLQVHMSSALAIALRKLNNSFVKQMAENQELRSQLRTVEAERDQAWRQAEWVAKELDQMNAKIDSPMSHRASGISAHQKSVARVSKAGLQAPSQRTSLMSPLGSALQNSMSPSNSRPQSRRVPTLRRRTPVLLLPDSPLMSTSALSTSGYTPSSTTMALARAQDELYAMLGLTNPERYLRRSRSWNALSVSSPPVSSLPADGLLSNDSLHPYRAMASRRSSLPPDSTLAQVLSALDADRNAVLLTFDMLSHAEEGLP